MGAQGVPGAPGQATGPAAETVGPEIGPEISGDFPEVLAALASRAEGLA
jgi:hypothetical protein